MATHVTIGVAPDVTGSPVPVDFVTLGSSNKRQTMTVSDASTEDMDAKVLAVDPAVTDNGLVVRPIQTGTTMTHLLSTGTSADATIVKASPGRLYTARVFNLNAVPIYVKFYEKITNPAPATDTSLLKFVVAVQAGESRDVTSARGITFVTGIAFAIVTGIANNNATAVTASTVLVNCEYI